MGHCTKTVGMSLIVWDNHFKRTGTHILLSVALFSSIFHINTFFFFYYFATEFKCRGIQSTNKKNKKRLLTVITDGVFYVCFFMLFEYIDCWVYFHHTFSFSWCISAVAMLCLSCSYGKKGNILLHQLCYFIFSCLNRKLKLSFWF